MEPIIELLQIKPINLAIKDIAKKAKTDIIAVEIAVVQFLIDFIGKTYNFNSEIYESLRDGDLDVEILVFQVFQAVSSN